MSPILTGKNRELLGSLLLGALVGSGAAIKLAPPPFDSHQMLDASALKEASNLGTRLRESKDGRDFILFLDYQCSACRAGALLTEAMLESRAPETGIVIVHFPLPGHKYSLTAARAAMAADHLGMGAQMHRRLLTAPDLSSGGTKRLAAELGIPARQWELAVKSQADSRHGEASFAACVRMHIRGTPQIAVLQPDGSAVIVPSEQAAIQATGRNRPRH